MLAPGFAEALPSCTVHCLMFFDGLRSTGRAIDSRERTLYACSASPETLAAGAY